MTQPWQVYDLLLDIIPDDVMVEEVYPGLTWTMVQTQERIGLAMGPEQGMRTLTWPDSLKGRHARELAGWIKTWDPYKAAVAMASINAAMPLDNRLLARAEPLSSEGDANRVVFDHFRPQLEGKKVVVVGRHLGLDEALQGLDATVLDSRPGPRDLPDSAAEYVIPGADWVFLNASCLANKSFPRLAELAADSNTVLMGPATPWLTELNEFGIDFLAGVRVKDAQAVTQTVTDGRGHRLLETGLEYCVTDLGACEMDWIKTAIADTVARREWIKGEMERWFETRQKGRFPQHEELMALDNQLSHLDSRFKRLWDARH